MEQLPPNNLSPQDSQSPFDAGSQKKPKKSKKLLLIIIVLIVVIAAAVLIFFLKPNLPAVAPNLNLSSPTNAPAEFDYLKQNQQNCAKTANPALCNEKTYDVYIQELMLEIIQSQDYNRCPELGLPDQANLCYSQLAYNLVSGEICAKISETVLKQSCLDNLIPISGDFSACGKLAAETQRDYCYKKIVSGFADKSECDKLSAADRLLCLEIFITAQAAQTQAYDLCQTIPTESGKNNCRRILPQDSDGDKLSDYAEKHFYFTDPQNPDTDGDGYPDGTEVRGGYNPKGEGKL